MIKHSGNRAAIWKISWNEVSHLEYSENITGELTLHQIEESSHKVGWIVELFLVELKDWELDFWF